MSNFFNLIGNYFDSFLFIIILISFVFGLYKGLVYSLLSSLGVIFSIFLALILFPYTKIYLTKHIHNFFILDISSFILSYVIAHIFTVIINMFLSNLLKHFRGGVVDRILGITFGIVRGLFFSIAIFWFLVFIFDDKVIDILDNREEFFKLPQDKHQPNWLKGAKSHDYIIAISKSLYDKFSKEQLENIKSQLLKYKKQNKDNNKGEENKKDSSSGNIIDKDTLLKLNQALGENDEKAK
jgi:membrane protein required for colicin V production